MYPRPELNDLGLPPGQEGAADEHPVPARPRQRHSPVPAVRPGSRARPARLLRQPRSRRPALHHAAGASRAASTASSSRSGSPRSSSGSTPARCRWSSSSTARPTSRRTPRRSRRCTPRSPTPSGSAPTRSATRSTSARRPQEQDFEQLPPGPRRRAATRHAADRVGLPARRGDRGQGRQGLLLRGRLRGPDRQRARRRRRQGELPPPREDRAGVPATYDSGVLHARQAIDAVVRSANRTLRARLRRGEGRRRGDAREGPRVDGGRRHRPDLRPQRLAARARRVAALRRRACATSSPSTPAKSAEPAGRAAGSGSVSVISRFRWVQASRAVAVCCERRSGQPRHRNGQPERDQSPRENAENGGRPR